MEAAPEEDAAEATLEEIRREEGEVSCMTSQKEGGGEEEEDEDLVFFKYEDDLPYRA